MNDHVKRGRADVFLFETESETMADVALKLDGDTVHGVGRARRRPSDPDIEGIGDELAAGRALIALGRRLLGITEQDITAVEGHPVHVSE